MVDYSSLSKEDLLALAQQEAAQPSTTTGMSRDDLLAAAKSEQATADGGDDKTGFFAALKSSIPQTAGSMATLYETAYPYLLGNGMANKSVDEALDQYRREKAAEAQAALPAGAHPFSGVKNLSDLSLALREQAGAAAPIIGSAALGSLGGPGGTMVAMYPFLAAGNLESQIAEHGYIKDPGTALATAVPQSAVFALAGNTPGAILGKDFIAKATSSPLGSFAFNTIKHAITGGGAMVTSKAMERWQAGMPLGDEHAMADYVEGALAGLFFAVPSAGLETGLQIRADKAAAAKKILDDQALQDAVRAMKASQNADIRARADAMMASMNNMAQLLLPPPPKTIGGKEFGGEDIVDVARKNPDLVPGWSTILESPDIKTVDEMRQALLRAAGQQPKPNIRGQRYDTEALAASGAQSETADLLRRQRESMVPPATTEQMAAGVNSPFAGLSDDGIIQWAINNKEQYPEIYGILSQPHGGKPQVAAAIVSKFNENYGPRYETLAGVQELPLTSQFTAPTLAGEAGLSLLEGERAARQAAAEEGPAAIEADNRATQQAARDTLLGTRPRTDEGTGGAGQAAIDLATQTSGSGNIAYEGMNEPLILSELRTFEPNTDISLYALQDRTKLQRDDLIKSLNALSKGPNRLVIKNKNGTFKTLPARTEGAPQSAARSPLGPATNIEDMTGTRRTDLSETAGEGVTPTPRVETPKPSGPMDRLGSFIDRLKGGQDFTVDQAHRETATAAGTRAKLPAVKSRLAALVDEGTLIPFGKGFKRVGTANDVRRMIFEHPAFQPLDVTNIARDTGLPYGDVLDITRRYTRDPSASETTRGLTRQSENLLTETATPGVFVRTEVKAPTLETGGFAPERSFAGEGKPKSALGAFLEQLDEQAIASGEKTREQVNAEREAARQRAAQLDAETEARQRVDVPDGLEEWDRSNKNTRSDALFEGDVTTRLAREKAVEEFGNRMAHGMAKEPTVTQSYRFLVKLLKNGIDETKSIGALYAAPLARETGEGGFRGTASGTAYTDGPFVLVADKGLDIDVISSVDQISGILVNDGIAGTGVIEALRKEFPRLSVESYSNTARLLSGEAPSEAPRAARPKAEARPEARAETRAEQGAEETPRPQLEAPPSEIKFGNEPEEEVPQRPRSPEEEVSPTPRLGGRVRLSDLGAETEGGGRGGRREAPQGQAAPSGGKGTYVPTDKQRLAQSRKVVADKLRQLRASGKVGAEVADKISKLLKNESFNAEEVIRSFAVADALSKIFGGTEADPRVEFYKSISERNPATDEFEEIAGEAIAAETGGRGLVKISLSKDISTALSRDTAFHEGFHFLQDMISKYDPKTGLMLFGRRTGTDPRTGRGIYSGGAFRDGMTLNDVDPSIRRVLQNAAPEKGGKSYWDILSERYSNDTVKAEFAKQREAAAYVFGALADAKNNGYQLGGLKPAFRRFLNFLTQFAQNLRNALRSYGYTNTAKVLSEYAAGKRQQGYGRDIRGDTQVGTAQAERSERSFVGSNSRNWSYKRQTLAELMEKNGYSPMEIWQRTGLHRGDEDGLWRNEIPDTKASIMITKDISARDGEDSLGNILKHDALFDEYPFLRNVDVFSSERISAGQGLTTEDSQIGISSDDVSAIKSGALNKRDLAARKKELVSTILHEVQHVIQRREDFATGSSAARERESIEEKISEEMELIRDDHDSAERPLYRAIKSLEHVIGSEFPDGNQFDRVNVLRFVRDGRDLYTGKYKDLEAAVIKKHLPSSKVEKIKKALEDNKEIENEIDDLERSLVSSYLGNAFNNYLKRSGERESRDVQYRFEGRIRKEPPQAVLELENPKNIIRTYEEIAADVAVEYEDIFKEAIRVNKDRNEQYAREISPSKTAVKRADAANNRAWKKSISDWIVDEEPQAPTGLEPERAWVGQKGRSWPVELQRKAEMDEANGKDWMTTYWSTGLYRGEDGKWRREIPDIKAKLDRQNISNTFFFTDNSGSTLVDQKATAPLTDLYDHKDIYKEYPFLKKYKMGVVPSWSDSLGEHNEKSRLINVNSSVLLSYISNKEGADLRLRKILTHEIQHAIQSHEGWSKGIHPDTIAAKARSDGHSLLAKIRDYAERDIANPLEKITNFANRGLFRDFRDEHGVSMDVEKYIQGASETPDFFRLKEVYKGNKRTLMPVTVGHSESMDLMRDLKRDPGFKYIKEARDVATKAYDILSDYDATVQDTMAMHDPYQSYLKNPGESESRDTEGRLELREDQLAVTLPGEMDQTPANIGAVEDVFDTLYFDEIEDGSAIADISQMLKDINARMRGESGVEVAEPSAPKGIFDRLRGLSKDTGSERSFVGDNSGKNKPFASEEEATRELSAKLAKIRESGGRKTFISTGKKAAQLSDWITAKFDPKGAMAERDLYRVMRNILNGTIKGFETAANEMRLVLDSGTPKQSQQIYEYLNKKGAVLPNDMPENLRDAAYKAKAQVIKLGRELIDKGMISEDVVLTNEGQYLPRMFMEHLKNATGFGTGSYRLSNRDYAKKRKNLSEEERIAKGEILSPGLPYLKAMVLPARDMAIIDFLSDVAETKGTGWVAENELVDWRGAKVSPFWLSEEMREIRDNMLYEKDPSRLATMRKVADDMQAIVDKTDMHGDVGKDYKRLPNTARYGALRGMAVRKEIYDDVVGMGTYTGDMKDFERILGRGVNFWKLSKTVASPTSHFRQIMSNMITADLSGISMHKIPVKMVQAIDDIMGDKGGWKVAKENGVTATGMVDQELKDALSDLKRIAKASGLGSIEINDWTKKWLKRLNPATLYQMEDNVFKVMKIRDELDKYNERLGPPKDANERRLRESAAVLEANEWFMDYSDVHSWVKYARESWFGAPFLTYQYKIAPRIAETILKRPWRIAKYVGLYYALPALAGSMLNLTSDDLDRLKKDMKEYLRLNPSALPLPWLDDRKNFQFIDMGYLFPWSYMTNMANTAYQTASGNATLTDVAKATGAFGNPVLTNLTAALTNIDTFTGKEIINKYDTPQDKAKDFLGYVWGQLAPPIITNYGAIGAPLGNLISGNRGDIDRKGNPNRSTAQLVAQAFGFNVYPVDPMRQFAQNVTLMENDITKARANLMHTIKDLSMSPENRAKMIEKRRADIMRRIQKMQKYIEEARPSERLINR